MRLFHWNSCPAEPAGHCALIIDENIAAFWPQMTLPKSTQPVRGIINTDKTLEFFIAGIRKLSFTHLNSQQLRLPSGYFIYQKIFDSLKQKTGTTLEDEVEIALHEWGFNTDSVIQATKALIQWVLLHEPEQFISFCIEKGKPDDEIELDFLDREKNQRKLSLLQEIEHHQKLLWYAKIGPKLDDFLQTHPKMGLLLPRLLPDTSGIQRFMVDHVRHNCASFIYTLLLEGNIENSLAGFSEKNRIGDTLQEIMRFNAQNPELSESDLRKAEKTKYLSWLLRCAGYGPSGITNWFGTTPRILHELSIYAKKTHEGSRASTVSWIVACKAALPIAIENMITLRLALESQRFPSPIANAIIWPVGFVLLILESYLYKTLMQHGSPIEVEAASSSERVINLWKDIPISAVLFCGWGCITQAFLDFFALNFGIGSAVDF